MNDYEARKQARVERFDGEDETVRRQILAPPPDDKVTASDELVPVSRDSAKCGIALRNQISEEVYYGMNLAIVLGHVHAKDPELFAAIQTVFNLAHKQRSK